MSDPRPHGIDDLDRLVSELHQISPAEPAAASSDAFDLAAWLQQVRDQDGSDLLLVSGLPPLGRVKGQVVRLKGDALSGEDVETAVSPVVSSRLRERYREGAAIDLAFTMKGLGRFRMNLHRER